MSDHAVSSVVCVAAVMVLAAVSIGAGSADPDALMARAKALHKAVPLIDGHNDFPWALREREPRTRFWRAGHAEDRRRRS